MADDQTHEPNPFLGPKPGEHLPEKKVSPQAMARLAFAADAIAATKRAIAHQGNQVSSLLATNMNSKYRLQVMRNSAAWEYTPEARALASQHKEADVAAKADLAHGGNCGEHSWVAFHYLREHATGQPINRVAPTYIDHAFVIIGDLKKDADNEMAVSDPWTNKPTAVLWEDHFSKGPRDQVESQSTLVADGNSYKEAIKAGLRLSAYGESLVKQADTEAQTKDATDHWKENHFWEQDDTAAPGAKFDYKVDQPATGRATAAPSQQPRP
jgi:hypothetical protein